MPIERIKLHNFEEQMSDQRRERQETREALKLLNGDAEKNGEPPIEVQQVLSLPPVPRQCIFDIDLATTMLGGMANQLALAGRQDLAVPFVQIVQALTQFRAHVVQREGSGIVVAKAGDVPPKA